MILLNCQFLSFYCRQFVFLAKLNIRVQGLLTLNPFLKVQIVQPLYILPDHSLKSNPGKVNASQLLLQLIMPSTTCVLATLASQSPCNSDFFLGYTFGSITPRPLFNTVLEMRSSSIFFHSSYVCHPSSTTNTSFQFISHLVNHLP